MREIVFRGKRIDNGEWVEGYYYKSKFYRTDKELSDYITIPYPDEENRGSDHFIVIPETVGQYTGLCDITRTKIFEGDIVKATISKFGGGYVSTIITVALDDYELMYDIERSDILEVIGNTHDNPVLLKGGDE